MSVKKNKPNKYATITHIVDLFLKIKEIAVILAAILLWILGVWFVDKLSPIQKDLQGVIFTAYANSERISECEDTNKNIDKKLNDLLLDTARIKGILEGKEIIN